MLTNKLICLLKPKLNLVLLTMALSSGFSLSAAKADVLGSFDINFQNVGTAAIFDQLEVSVYFGGIPVPPYSGAAIVPDVIVSSNDVGKTFSVSSGSEFDAAVAYLTNGVNDQVAYFTSSVGGDGGGGVSTGTNESALFFPGQNRVDFAGDTIDSLSLTVNSLDFSINLAQNWTNFNFNGTVDVIGSVVPLPGAIWLFAGGLMGWLGVRAGSRR